MQRESCCSAWQYAGLGVPPVVSCCKEIVERIQLGSGSGAGAVDVALRGDHGLVAGERFIGCIIADMATSRGGN